MASSDSDFVDSSMRSNVKILPGAVVCNECELRGDITIGSLTVIHPKARIIAEGGPIVIGEANLIEEQATIINRAVSGQSGQPVMTIGSHNVFEVDAYSEALHIGDNNVLESKCHVGRSVELTGGCIIGAGCRVAGPEVVPENTVLFGKDCSRRKQMDKPPTQTLQMDFLTKVLPNYHHLKRPMKKNP